MQALPEDDQGTASAGAQDAAKSARSTAEDVAVRVPSVQLRTGQGSGLVSPFRGHTSIVSQWDMSRVMGIADKAMTYMTASCSYCTVGIISKGVLGLG